MEQREIAVLMKAIAPVIREAIVNAVKPVADRLIALEGREPEKGEKGEAGRDGIDLTSFDAIVLDDDRTIEFKFVSGDEERVASFKWPTVLDRGPFKIDRELPYEAGDGVTWGGQFYICNEPTNEKPDQSKDGKPWRLAIRKGRNGKDASG